MDSETIRKAASTKLNKKLTQLSRAESECSIYRVHWHLRSLNPKAYEPEVIAIGPYHRHHHHLQIMEHHKLSYMNSLLKFKNESNADNYVAAIAGVESQARKCYADPTNLNEIDFVQMLVLDGCFIVELARKSDCKFLRDKSDPIFQMDWIINSLKRDLMLFENQVPFFVLCKLFDLIEVPNQRSRLTYLLLNFFKILYPGNLVVTVDTNEIKHLLNLIHRSWVPLPAPLVHNPNLGGKEREKRLRFINNATGLREANVRFERNEGATLLDIKFDDGVMKMAPLTVEDRTESFFRNLIAYEQYFHHDHQQQQQSFVTDYVKLLDSLIDSSKDVEIMSRYGIIENWLGDDEVVAKMVNKLTDSVAGPGDRFIYAEMSEKVNKYCKNQRNRWMAKLKRNYLNSPWDVISIFVAAVLLLLTITQTVFTILQLVLKH